MSNKLEKEEKARLLTTLEKRFNENQERHKKLKWDEVEKKLVSQPKKLWSLFQMEESGGEPDVISFERIKDEYIFVDCSKESPKERRSLCYDIEAWESRKKHKPDDNALDVAKEIGIELLTEEEYYHLQKYGEFDTKTSSWLKTPAEVRKLGGAIFGDFRYGRVFIYHNGAESYYAARGFRGLLRV